MCPTDNQYLFSIPEEMQFPAARCAQGNSVCMYGKSGSLGVEAMNRENEDIHQKAAVDMLNATMILLKKESTRYDKQLSLAWNPAYVLTPRGMELMDKAFNNVKSQVAVSATTAVYDGLEILCALATNTGLRLSDK